jgi:hypothetical protein
MQLIWVILSLKICLWMTSVSLNSILCLTKETQTIVVGLKRGEGGPQVAGLCLFSLFLCFLIMVCFIIFYRCEYLFFIYSIMFLILFLFFFQLFLFSSLKWRHIMNVSLLPSFPSFTVLDSFQKLFFQLSMQFDRKKIHIKDDFLLKNIGIKIISFFLNNIRNNPTENFELYSFLWEIHNR